MASKLPPAPSSLISRTLKLAASKAKPIAFVLAGHNGSGKSTLWNEVMAPTIQVPLINADRMMLSILPEHYTGHSRAARSVRRLPSWAQNLRDTNESWMGVAQRGVQTFVSHATEAGLPFAFETVFSHWRNRGDGTFESKIDVITTLQESGYFVTLLFVGLANVNLSIVRVQTRRGQGGHDVPTPKLIERFPRTQLAVREAASIADMTLMFDNSRSVTKAFTLARAQAQKHVMYDCRDPRFDQDSGLLMAANEWLQQLAPLARS